MLQIAVCDDNKKELTEILQMLSEYAQKAKDYDFNVHGFSSSKELLISMDGNDFDFYLLDIVMPDITGLQLAEAIRQKDEQAVIMFLTSSAEYSLDSYSVRAFSYILKPVSKEELFSCLDRAIQAAQIERSRCVLVKTKEGICPLTYPSIIYVEYRSHYLYYHLTDGRVVKSTAVTLPFTDAAAQLFTDPRFIKTSNAYIANMDHVKLLSGRKFIMVNGQLLSISRSSYKEIKRTYIDYILKRGISP